MTQEQLPMVAMPSMNDTHLEEMIIINQLDAAAKENNVELVAKVLQDLLEHTIIHFSDEEDMMEEALFPAYQMHKSEHDRHIHELKALVKYFDENRDPKAITAYIDGNLTKWLVHHIETMDTITAQFLQQGMV